MRARVVLLPALVVGLLTSASLLRVYGAASAPHGELDHDCAECHTVERWTSVKGATRFRHDTTGFLLKGAHVRTRCTGCHRSLKFSRVGVACGDCHKDAHRGALGVRCEPCHTPETWTNQRDMSRGHSGTRFPLFGVHARLDCDACHHGQQPFEYASTPSDCGGCHLRTFRETANPPHARAGFSLRCEECHPATTPIWRGARFAHDTYPLQGRHVTAACADCHASSIYRGTSRTCYDCHRSDYDGAQSPNHRTGRLSTDCGSCHQLIGWRPATVNHSQTRFPLTGAHAGMECARCHPGGRYAGTPTDCFSCHQSDRSRAPNHASYPTQCDNCHQTAAWRPASVTHSGSYPLTGAHTRVACASCHVNGRYAGTPRDCASCHQSDRNRAPNHASYPTQCDNCHQTAAWKPASFNHNGSYPLTGAHTGIACASCHAGGRYAGTPRECASCHQSDRSRAPNHASYPTQCDNCHQTAAWKPASVSHNGSYPLTGAHARVACASCHVNGRYAGTPRDCASCHQSDRNRAPNHASYPAQCDNCHQTAAWKPASFNHNGSYPLTGAHTGVACASCHVNGRYAGTPRDCASCHQSDRNRAPNHASYPTQCDNCHQTGAWKPASFNHNGSYPLTGAHTGIACASCHVNGRYAGTPRDCASCHQSDRNRAPNHASYPTQCDNCHQTGAWKPASFNHSSYSLTGAHTGLACASCHVNGRYAGTPRDCASCHQSDRSRAPNHASYPTQCDNCHQTGAWKPASFNHSSYSLTGAHTGLACASCHANGRYAGTPRDCASCHQSDRNRAPNHASYPTQCDNCHQTGAWKPASFNHSSYSLTGAHTGLACASCHANGRYAGTPRDCASCHQSDRNRAPNHASYPTQCDNCHQTGAWKPASFNHSSYSLTGAHTGLACASCHANGRYAGTPRDCASCHQSDRNRAPNHASYPTQCDNCHQTGAWKPASFNHNGSYALTGAHASVACASCHAGGRYAGTPTSCAACHQANYNRTTSPNHGAAGFPTQCDNCHTTSGWTPATFDHDGRFPIYSGSHRGRWSACSDCHVNPGNYGSFECITCHAHSDKAQVDSHHKGTSGYQYSSAACYRCHPRGTH